jgi:uncharacterized membrane protein YtjA (UPF0391 family)
VAAIHRRGVERAEGICSRLIEDFPLFRGLIRRNFHFGRGLVLQRKRRNGRVPIIQFRERVMLSWVVTFLIIALVAGLLGFGGIAGASIEIAKMVFFIAIVLFVISALVGLARGGRTTLYKLNCQTPDRST